MNRTRTQIPPGPVYGFTLYGFTLIELVIVVALVGVLLTLAVPSFQSHMLRVHRTQAVRLLLQAAMCQERLYAIEGKYNTAQCRPDTKHQHYQFKYLSADSQGHGYLAMASPKGAQLADPCGTLSLDQSGVRGVSAKNIKVAKCWNGR